MTLRSRTYIVILLGLSALFLASLIPGGPIENRDFSHIDVSILGGFNIFLTVLNLSTIALLYFVFRNRAWAITATWFTGFAYFFVYGIDLAQIFPRSPTPMSHALSLIEVLGMCVAVPMMYLSWRYTPFARHRVIHEEINNKEVVSNTLTSSVTGLRIMLVVLSVVIGAGIIIFATESAIHSSTVPKLSER